MGYYDGPIKLLKEKAEELVDTAQRLHEKNTQADEFMAMCCLNVAKKYLDRVRMLGAKNGPADCETA